MKQPQFGVSEAPQRRAWLLERGSELETIRAGIARVQRGQGQAVVVEGPPGIGKTALVSAARSLALEAGVRVLAARGHELERAFGFGVVRQLLEPAIRSRDGVSGIFRGAAAHAADLFEVEVDDVPPVPAGPEAVYAVLRGLHGLVVNLAVEGPLAILVDDAHWADAASLRFLAYLARRLDGVAVLLLAATRPAGEPGAEPVIGLLEISPLRLRALSAAAAARVVRVAVPDASDELCRACHRVTGGNPLFLRELAASLKDAGRADVERVLSAAPAGVVTAMRARLARFSEAARALAGAAAILGDGALVRHAAAIAELEVGAAAHAADVLRAGRILADERPLSFMHPMVRDAVYEQLRAAERSAGHARAARLLAREDAAAERVAAHLLHAEPCGCEWVSERLRDAAREALRHGAPDASVAFLRRALEEPPSDASRPAVLLELGLAEALMLDREPAVEHLRRGVESTRDTTARLYAARMLGSIVGLDVPAEGVEILERALQASPDADRALTGHIEAHLVNVARFSLVGRSGSVARARRVSRRVESGEAAGPVELAAAATELTMKARSSERVVRLARRAIAGLSGDPLLPLTLAFAARCLAAADQLGEAESVLTDALDEAARHHAAYRIGPLLAYRSEVRLWAGDARGAVSDAEAALGISRAAGRTAVLGATAMLVRALTERGALDAAQAAVDGLVDTDPDSYMDALLLYARGRLQLARGDPEAALEHLREVGRRLEIVGEANPALVDWRSQAAIALARLGRREQALALARADLTLARRFGAPRAVGLTLRACGVIERSEPRLRQAVATLSGSHARLEQARALTDLGVQLRRDRRIVEAREPLRRALDLAESCGAQPLAELAGTELRIAGARPRRARLTGRGALTTNEARVAELAADGRSNAEIAQALFVSRKTVEKHLGAAYRKLGIGSRGELAAALAKE